MFICGRCRETDEIETSFKCRQAHFFVFFCRQVYDDEAVDTRGLGVRQELLHPVMINRVVVAHQNDRRRVVPRTELAYQVERFVHRLAGFKRAQVRGLDGRSFRHRIGEGHAYLYDISSRTGKTFENAERCLKVRVTCCDESDEGSPAFLFELCETCVDAGGHVSFTPRCSATEKTSLSPRPHIFITIK